MATKEAIERRDSKKREELGMHHGTAQHRLRQKILFDLIKKTEQDWCFQCGAHIETVDDLSIEHKISWRGNPELFWDLDNIAFSHKSCNYSAGNPTVMIDGVECCRKGHPRTKENMRIEQDGEKTCRVCYNIGQNKRRGTKNYSETVLTGRSSTPGFSWTKFPPL